MKIAHFLRAGLLSIASALAWPVAFALVFLGAGLVRAQPDGGASGVFEETGSLGAGRYGHTATLLPSGKVLAVGGRTGFPSGTILASAELYDPANGTWMATGNLGIARWIHTATLLPNGKVLIVGGQGASGYLGSAELYDPATGTWMATGSTLTPRAAHTETLLPNGKVLITGGLGNSGGALASAELYDPASGTWTATGSLAGVRSYHTATLLPDGRVLVAAGVAPGGSLGSAELYDPASGIWATTGSLAFPRDTHTATLLPNGEVLVAAGYGNMGSRSASAELYDPASGTWTAAGSLSNARYHHTATLLPDDTVLVVGGGGAPELYDPATGIWTATGSTVTPRDSHTATLLPSSKVLVAGGFGGNCCPALAGAELYVAVQPILPGFLNISTRLRVLTDDNVLIGGFIITGTDPKTVLIRGIGPSLSGVGLAGALMDPMLELHQGNTTVATNDNWKTRPDGTSQQAEIEATTIPPTNDLESAILATLNPGAYTAILAGKNGGTGLALVEVYDLVRTAASLVVNISTRGFVGTGDNVMIGGFVVGGGSGGGHGVRVLVRVLGPSVPVAGALSDPNMELRTGDGTLVDFNDNWKTHPNGSSQQAEIEATGIPPTNDLESALVQTLQPGNYTAIVRGKVGATGVGLVEVYNLP